MACPGLPFSKIHAMRDETVVAHKLGISPKTVETHRLHVKEKLGLTSVADLTRFAVREGLVSPDR